MVSSTCRQAGCFFPYLVILSAPVNFPIHPSAYSAFYLNINFNFIIISDTFPIQPQPDQKKKCPLQTTKRLVSGETLPWLCTSIGRRQRRIWVRSQSRPKRLAVGRLPVLVFSMLSIILYLQEGSKRTPQLLQTLAQQLQTPPSLLQLPFSISV